MRGLKIATLIGMGLTLALFVAAAVTLGNVRDASRSAKVVGFRQVRNLSFGGVAVFFVTAVTASLLFAKEKRAYREESKRNLEALIEGTRDDLASRRKA